MNRSIDINVRLLLEEAQALLGKFDVQRFSVSLHGQGDELKHRGRFDCSGLDAETNLHFIMVPQEEIAGSATFNVSNLHGNRIELTLAEHDDVVLAREQFGASSKTEAAVFGTSWYPAPEQLLMMLRERHRSTLEQMQTEASPVIHAFWNCRMLLQYDSRFWTMGR